MSHQKNPYGKYEGSPVWKAVEKAIGNLVENQDIQETTKREYIVGYITSQVEMLSGITEKVFRKES